MNSHTFPNPYALIVGNGRSGTNWLLTMLNASEMTHCRNEPQHIANSPIHHFPSPEAIATNTPEMDQKWKAFVEWTATHIGERDIQVRVCKAYFHRLAHSSGAANWPMRPKLRQALSFLFPSFRQGEWPLPWWIGSQQRLAQAYSIFKLNDLPAWTVRWVLDHHPEVPVLHIVRHPGGQLYSGIKRFFSKLNSDEIYQETRLYQNLLKTAIHIDPKWSIMIPEIDKMDLTEALAWFWRYNNEVIYQAGCGRDNYHCVVYENLAQDPLGTAKNIFQFCDIPWSEQVEGMIAEGTSTSVWGKLPSDSKSVSTVWQQKLPSNDLEIINQVLSTSVMESWWDIEPSTCIS